MKSILLASIALFVGFWVAELKTGHDLYEDLAPPATFCVGSCGGSSAYPSATACFLAATPVSCSNAFGAQFAINCSHPSPNCGSTVCNYSTTYTYTSCPSSGQTDISGCNAGAKWAFRGTGNSLPGGAPTPCPNYSITPCFSNPQFINCGHQFGVHFTGGSICSPSLPIPAQCPNGPIDPSPVTAC